MTERILIITPCTNSKRHKPANQFTQDELIGMMNHNSSDVIDQHVKKLIELAPFREPARDMYTGQHHIRLMRGVDRLNTAEVDVTVDVHILSAGFGLLPADETVPPYECTFNGMPASLLGDWATALEINRYLQELYDTGNYDYVIVLLGAGYLKACDWDNINVSVPTLFITSEGPAEHIPSEPLIHKYILSIDDTKRFSCGQIGLKGEVACRLLTDIANGTLTLKVLASQPDEVLDAYGPPLTSKEPKKTQAPIERDYFSELFDES